MNGVLITSMSLQGITAMLSMTYSRNCYLEKKKFKQKEKERNDEQEGYKTSRPLFAVTENMTKCILTIDFKFCSTFWIVKMWKENHLG